MSKSLYYNGSSQSRIRDVSTQKQTFVPSQAAQETTKLIGDSRFDVIHRQRLAHEISYIKGNKFLQKVAHPPAQANTKIEHITGNSQINFTSSNALLHENTKINQSGIKSTINDILQKEGDTLNKAEAIKAILSWHQSYIDFTATTQQWLSNNLTQYLSMASSDPGLGLSKGDIQRIAIQEFSGSSSFPLAEINAASLNTDNPFDTIHSISSNAVGNAVEGGIDLGFEKVGLGGIGAFVGAFFGPAGAAAGFFVSVLIETLAGAAYDIALESAGWGGNDVAMAEGSRHTGRLIRESNSRLSKTAQNKRAQSYQMLNTLMTQANSATTQDFLDALLEQVEEQTKLCQKRPSESDYSLAKKLLSIWVLEHAGDEADAREGSSEAQWEAARKHVFGGGDMGDLNHVADLFAYQTRLHWLEAGLNGSRYVNPMFEHLRFLNQPAYSNLSSEEKAEYMKMKFHKKQPYIFDSGVDLRKFTKLLARYKPVHAAFLSDFATNGYRIECVLDLTISNNSCYINEWEYTIGAPDSDAILASFDVSPD